jgi:hypothetical protein
LVFIFFRVIGLVVGRAFAVGFVIFLFFPCDSYQIETVWCETGTGYEMWGLCVLCEEDTGISGELSLLFRQLHSLVAGQGLNLL